MKYAFSAANTKIVRARKHLAELETEASAFIASGATKFAAEIVETNGARAFKFTAHISGAPESIGAIVGDVIHNLRTALDLTACEIVRAAQQNDKDVYFPFSESAAELDNMICRRHFDRAGTDAVALLKSLKPYRNGNVDLRLIHDLDIHDKHRALIPSLVGAASPIIQLWEDDGTVNPRVMGDPTSPSEVRLIFPNESGAKGQELVPTLHKLVQLVESIVEMFRVLANRGQATV